MVVKNTLSEPQPLPPGLGASVDSLLALRREASQLTLGLSKRAHSVLAGRHGSRIRGRGMDFAESRRYQPGDDARHIDWRITARTQTPHTKLYIEERERPVLVLVDFPHTLFFGSKPCLKSVTAARIAALLAWTTIAENDRIGGIISSTHTITDIKPRPGRRGALPLMAALSDASLQMPASRSADSASTLESGLTHACRVAHPGSLVMVISDFFGFTASCKHRLNQLQRHNDLLLFEIIDPLEKSAPTAGRYAVTNGLASVTINTENQRHRDQFETSFHAKHEALAAFARSSDLRLIPITNTDDPSRELHHHFSPRRENGETSARHPILNEASAT